MTSSERPDPDPADARNGIRDLRAAARLVIEATRGVAGVVESMHHTIVSTPAPLGPAIAGPARGIAGLAYRSVRGVAGLVGGGVDSILAALEPLVPARAPAAWRENAVSALNGVLGDHLQASANPLAIEPTLVHQGLALRLRRDWLSAHLAQPGEHLLVLVHGLCMNDRLWSRQGHEHGAALAQASGATALHLRYNSGRHIAANGLDLSTMLVTLVEQWPRPVSRITLLTHSMGGLVTRSAIHQARAAGMGWPDLVGQVFFLGTPHLGAPLERGGHWIDLALGASPYTAALARIGNVRSAGITDLRHGSVLAADAQASGAAAPFLPLPQGLRCYAMAATLSRKLPGANTEADGHMVLPRLSGDGLVPVRSALGLHRDPARSLDFAPDRQWIGAGLNHLDLLGSPRVFERLRAWMAQDL